MIYERCVIRDGKHPPSRTSSFLEYINFGDQRSLFFFCKARMRRRTHRRVQQGDAGMGSLQNFFFYMSVCAIYSQLSVGINSYDDVKVLACLWPTPQAHHGVSWQPPKPHYLGQTDGYSCAWCGYNLHAGLRNLAQHNRELLQSCLWLPASAQYLFFYLPIFHLPNSIFGLGSAWVRSKTSHLKLGIRNRGGFKSVSWARPPLEPVAR